MADTSLHRSALARLWRFTRVTAVVVFVCWHLFFLLFRNPLDLWWDDLKPWVKEQDWWAGAQPVFEPVDVLTRRYGNLISVQQGWTMFAPPLARSAPFLAARLDFTDGSASFVFSENEPDPTNFLRIGGWRQRKLEDYMVYTKPHQLPDHEELALFESYARWCARRWQEAHPDDARELAQVVLLKRRFDLPPPDRDPRHFDPPTVTVIGTFGPDGRLRDVPDAE
jgi:hypothetical protein